MTWLRLHRSWPAGYFRYRIDAGLARRQVRDGFRHPGVRRRAQAERPRRIWPALTLAKKLAGRRR